MMTAASRTADRLRRDAAEAGRAADRGSEIDRDGGEHVVLLAEMPMPSGATPPSNAVPSACTLAKEHNKNYNGRACGIRNFDPAFTESKNR
jgi:hypothetical protein